ncbi:putative transaldolase [Candidatus Protochlamydia naegleriophila]|uniref:Putative transaldolase n=1 Tax=Candidatus Protochlamydia naegleriophila TaxID=389348 RepID=A0A0U5J6I3_9BACT|nr:transaldolase family protein [Candidatus Protochlamydia naegleriophila]CUI15657.1 putative transaldolase [Candidatus Protochlamydia naegleriophila]
MDIWLDTTNVKTIQKAVRVGILSGVTTNPSLLAHNKKDVEKTLEDLLHHQEGPVTVQVVADDTHEMLQQGQMLYSFSNRIIVKVPITKNGLEAIHLLVRQGIPTMATVVFHPRQALMAALAGANYVAPYISRIEKMGKDPWEMLNSMTTIFQHYRLQTKILGASLSSIEQVVKCAEIGIYGVTLKDEIFEKMIEDNPATLEGVHQFSEDWKKASSSLFSS